MNRQAAWSVSMFSVLFPPGMPTLDDRSSSKISVMAWAWHDYPPAENYDRSPLPSRGSGGKAFRGSLAPWLASGVDRINGISSQKMPH